MERVSFPDENLVAVVERQGSDRPQATHMVLLADDGTAEPLTYGELLSEARSVAAGLAASGVGPGSKVALMLPTGRGFFFSFAGTLLAGCVPVPIYPPVKIDQIEEYARRQVGILANAGARALVTPKRARQLARLLRPRVPSLEAILAVEEVLEGGGRAAPAARPRAEDPGLIQYTSGSTGDPKGVVLTHANLLANVRSIGEAVGVTSDDVVVSWLPLYHDMGLIGCWLFALCHGVEMTCFSPLAFLRQPRRWLWAISEYRATLSPAPNFAYELCLRRIRNRDLEGVDLSSWRMALNGAEPVDPDTIERFIQRFGPHGFRRGAMAPVYGLAENAVALAFPPVGRPPRIEEVSREQFQRHGRAVPVEAGAVEAGEPMRWVSVGRPIPDNELRVVDEDDRPVAERIEGDIQFRGPSATPGYHENPAATAAIRTPDGWTRTGDRGYLADGELFITGRLKDLIIKAGRNLDPAEVERLAGDVDGIRRGCVAAFGVPSPRTGSEEMIVVAETRSTRAAAREKLASAVRRQVRSVIRVSPDAVLLVPPRTLPKTPSGKLRRSETRQRYLANALVQRRPPAWVQIVRLAAGAAWLGLVAWLWRGRHRT